MSDLITDAVPAPRTVRVGGRLMPVPECRLCDLAALQRWVSDRWGDPVSEAWGRASAMDRGPGRDRLLFEALDATADGPPAYDSLEGWLSLATPEGVVFLASLALRNGTPGLSDEELAGLIAGMGPGEYDGVTRAFFGSDLRAVMEREVTDHLPRPESRPAVTWAKAVAEVCELYHLSPREVSALTLSEFRLLRSGGEGTRGVRVTSAEGAWEAVERRRAEAFAAPRARGAASGGRE